MSKPSKPLSIPGLTEALDWNGMDRWESFFRQGLELPFGQSWLDQPEANFQTGKVQVLWEPRHLHVLATFQDEDIVVLSANGMMRSLCVSDIFQIFVDNENGLDYREIHVTPDNQSKLLVWSEESFRKFNEGEVALDAIWEREADAFQTHTWIEKEKNQWAAHLALSPSFFTPGKEAFAKGDRYRMGFCRFDTSPGASQSVLSASCTFKDAPLFHKKEYWHDLQLV